MVGKKNPDYSGSVVMLTNPTKVEGLLRELQNHQVACPVCGGTGKKQFHHLANYIGTVRCKLCKGSGRIPQSYILTKLEEKVLDCIYEQIPVGAMCPRCGAEIDPDECIDDTISSRKDWAKMVREVIKIVKEESNDRQEKS